MFSFGSATCCGSCLTATSVGSCLTATVAEEPLAVVILADAWLFGLLPVGLGVELEVAATVALLSVFAVVVVVVAVVVVVVADEG